MNIVLRKNFTGRSFTLQVGEATRGGGREALVTWIEGLASASGRTKATIIGDFQSREALRLGDRDFLFRAIARLPPASLLSEGGPFGPDSRAVLRAELTGYPAVFTVASASVDLGIPEKPGVQFALMPPGSNAATLNPASFAETDPTALKQRRQDRVVLRSPVESFNFSL